MNLLCGHPVIPSCSHEDGCSVYFKLQLTNSSCINKIPVKINFHVNKVNKMFVEIDGLQKVFDTEFLRVCGRFRYLQLSVAACRSSLWEFVTFGTTY